MKLTVGVAAVPLGLEGTVTPVIQNLGPGDLYLGGADVTVADGFKLAPNAVYEYPRDLGQGAGKIHLVSSMANTDVRVLVVG